MNTGRSTGLKHFVITRSDAAIANIVHYGIIKQNGALRDDANPIAKTCVMSAAGVSMAEMEAYLKRSTSRMSWPSMRMHPLVTS